MSDTTGISWCDAANCLAVIIGALRSGPMLSLDLMDLDALQELPLPAVAEALIGGVRSGVLRRLDTPQGWLYELEGVDIDAVHRDPRWHARPAVGEAA